MTIKSALSVAALTIALTGAAFAQGMTINGVAVSESDMAAVQERCDQLSTAATTESIAGTTENGKTESTEDSSAGGTDATVTDAPAVNEAQAATATIDLDTITLEACTTGGFVTQ